MNAADRRASRICLSVALTSALMMCAIGAGAAEQDTPRPDTAPPPGSNSQPASPSTKSLSDLAPKAIVVDPCKAKDPPPYCAKN